MNTTNTDILRSFYSVTNRNKLTEEIFNILLKRWELTEIDLEEEMIKIKTKKSFLSKSKRDAIPEFIKLKEMLKGIKKSEQESINFSENNQTNEISPETEILVGNNFDNITNVNDVELNAEIV